MELESIDILLLLAKIGLIYFVILTLAAYLVFAERRILAWIQDRKGPNRVGPQGLLQPLADLIKLLTKEDFRPMAADRWLFYLAPAMAAIPAIMTFAVVPFGAPVLLFLLSGIRAVQLAREGEVPEAWRDLNCDGKVSWAEWLRGGIDFRLRPSQLVPGCQDVYAVKTGRALVVRCEAAPQCRPARDFLK